MDSTTLSTKNKSSKLIKCYCNDDMICPRQFNSNPNEKPYELDQSKMDNFTYLQSINVKELIEKTNGNIRHCLSKSVCLTKKLRKMNGETRMRYYCSSLPSDSIREQIIEYRDCKYNTENKHDLEYVKGTTAEYCCDNQDFCNINLVPNKHSIDIVEYNQLQQNNPGISDLTMIDNKNNNESNKHFRITLDPIQQCLIIGLLTAFILCLLYLTFKIARKFFLKSKSNVKAPSKTILTSSSSSSSSTSSSSSNSPNSTHKSKNFHLLTGASSTTNSPPYSSALTTTTNTSVTSKESSYQSSSEINKHLMYHHDVSLKSAAQAVAANPEIFEPFIGNGTIDVNLDNTKQLANNSTSLSSTSDYPGMIKISSPLSLTQSYSYISSNLNNHMNNSNTNNSNVQSPSEFEWSGSGSGAGLPECVQRTIARQIKLFYPCIGKGRFGEVYKGEWRGEYVAVKTFNSADEKSWDNECRIYDTKGFRHENILGFIAADNIDRGTYTELWLITEFHENGSLYDYLSLNTVTTIEALKMALSIANGLVHLHMSIDGQLGKPALAHCDLKSKNILVKSDLTCCISDFGLALSGDKDGKVIHNGNPIRTGTKRYLAPEILSKKIKTERLLEFQKAEMYSLGLVFWELLRRCKLDDQKSNKTVAFEYKPPYYEWINGDPDEPIMKKIVCEEKFRPLINPLWKNDLIMKELTNYTQELWVDDPDARLNPLRLKKSLIKVKNNYINRPKLQTIQD